MIFISYRKEDSGVLSGSLAKSLIERFGKDSVFLDKEKIQPGDRWREEIDRELAKAAVVLAVIGPRWLTAHDEYGQRRIDRDEDVLAYELWMALKRGIVIIPLYLDGLKPWPAKAFPDRLKGLAEQQGIEFDIATGMPALCEELEKIPGLRNPLSIPKETFRNWIRPLSFETQLDENLATRFTGRQWVEAGLDEWIIKNPDSKVFCLLGGPGIGKSAIACHWRDTRIDIIAFHRCEYGDTEKTDPKSILPSLAAQIARHLPEYEKHLSALSIDEVRKVVAGTAKTIFESLLWKPLHKDFPDPGRTLLVVIDGLDEASREHDNELASFVGEVWSGLPDWLRLVVTSRPELDVRSYLSNLNPFLLEASSPENLKDICAFLTRELAAKNASSQVINEIVEKSEGMFLYATLVVDEIRSGLLSLSQTSEFPKGLTGFYRKWFNRKFPQVETYRRELHDLVSVIVAQLAPLPLPVLQNVFRLTKQALKMRLMKLGVFFPLRKDRQGNQEVVTWMHKSLRDWLTEENLSLHPKAGEFAADPDRGNQLLAEEGWRVYSRGELAQHPYFSQTLLEHLTQAKEPDKLASVLLDPVLVDTLWSNEFRYEWQRHISELRHTVSLSKLVQEWLAAHASPGISTSQDAVVTVRLCRLFQELGAFDEAISLAEAALRVWEANHVSDSPDMLWAFLALGKIQFAQERLDSATTSYQKALEIAQRAYTPGSQQMAEVLYDLYVFYKQGKRDYKEASECLEKCWSIRSRRTPPDFAGMAICINDRVVILEAEGKTADYLGMYREALALFEKAQPDGHPEMVATLGNIGNALRSQGKREDAIEMFRRSAAMADRILLPQHEYASFACANLAFALLDMGMYDEALTTMRSYVQALERFPGPDHYETAAARVRFCEVLCHTVHLADSGKREEYREKLRGQCQLILKAKPATVLDLLVLSEHSRRAAEPTLQNWLQETALRSCRNNAEMPHANPSDSVAAKCFSDTLRTLMPDQLLSELAPKVVSLWESAKPQMEHEADCLPKTRKVIINLIAWAGRTRLERVGNIADVQEAFDLVTQIGAESPDTLDRLASLAVALHRRHHEEASESLCQRLAEKSGRILGLEHVQTLGYLENLAFLKMYRGSLDEAESLYRSALQSRLNIGGVEQANTLATISRLAECLLLRGSTDVARNLIRELVPKLPTRDAFFSARKELARSLSSAGMQLKNEFSAFDASRVCYELSLEIDPNSAGTHNNFALLLWICLEEAGTAAEHFKQSMALNPGDGNTCGNYAHMLAQTIRDPELAFVNFEKAMSLSPNDGGIPGNFAAFLIQKRELAKAWGLAERATRIGLPNLDRMMARPLFCAAAIMLLQGREPSVPLGQLKTLFERGIDHVPWVLNATLDMLHQELEAESDRLMTAIWRAIGYKSGLETLTADSAWQAIKPVASVADWPFLALQNASGS